MGRGGQAGVSLTGKVRYAFGMDLVRDFGSDSVARKSQNNVFEKTICAIPQSSESCEVGRVRRQSCEEARFKSGLQFRNSSFHEVVRSKSRADGLPSGRNLDVNPLVPVEPMLMEKRNFSGHTLSVDFGNSARFRFSTSGAAFALNAKLERLSCQE